MTETVPERLIRSLRTEAPYKHALEIMVDDLTQWLRDENVHDGDIFEHSIILGQGDYPTGRQIIENAVRKMNEAATALEAAQARVRELEAGYDDQKWKRYAAEMELAHTATARREALEAAAKVLDRRVREICDKVGNYDSTTNHVELPEWAETACEELEAQAAAIRALMEKPNENG